jgi:exonuclease VII large subunit
MDMALADLVADLKTSLPASAAGFKAADDADFKRFLAQALPDMQFKRPVSRLASVSLQADLSRYAMPVDDFAAFKVCE